MTIATQRECHLPHLLRTIALMGFRFPELFDFDTPVVRLHLYVSSVTQKKTYMHRLPFLFILAFSITTHAQDTARQIPLWPNGAPGFENRRDEPEEAKDY